jgi:hypothetical protein
MVTATVIVHWPGKDVPACREHARKLISIGNSIGCPVSVTPLFGDDIECTNCKNEGKSDDSFTPRT